MIRDEELSDVVSRKRFVTGEELESIDGAKLNCRYWIPHSVQPEPQGQDDEDEERPFRPVGKPKAVAFISHGFSEHLGLYEGLGMALSAENVFCFGHDHVGHGRSGGERVQINTIDHYVADMNNHCKIVKEVFPDSPLFLIGHSMGGMIILHGALTAPQLYDGLIFQGPLVIPGPDLWRFRLRLSMPWTMPVKFVLGLLEWWNPELVLGTSVLDMVTRDPDMKSRLAADPLRWKSGCKVRLLNAFVRCVEANLVRIPELHLPFLALHGDDDWLCNPAGSRELYDRASTVDKTIKIYPNGAHQLFLERAEIRNDAIEQVVEWIKKRSH